MKTLNPESKKYNRLVLILGFAGFISAADNWFVAPILPAIASGLKIPVARASMIITAYMLPYGFMQPLYGFFSDRHSKVKTLRWITGGLALGTAGCAMTGSLLQLCFFRMVTGFFAAGIIAVSLALIGDTVPDSLGKVYVGRFIGIVFLGQGISTGLGGICAQLFNWRVTFGIFCALALINQLLLGKLPEGDVTSPEQKLIPAFQAALTSKKGRIIFPLALAAGCCLLGVYSFIGSYLHEKAGLTYLQSGLVMMFYGLACLSAGTLSGNRTRKLKPFDILRAGSYFAFGAPLLLAVFPFWQTGLVATIALGFGYILIQSTLATLAFQVSVQSKGLSSGLVGLGLFCGGGIGTSMNGWILAHAGYHNLWLILTGEIGILGLLFRKARGLNPRS
ncbi:MAG TPA: MFS transporter [Firmicutes bacterium]|nr:MFS transporter [Bacillota bacterium]